MGKYDPRLPDRRLGLKDAGFNNLRQERERPAIQQNGEIATYDATAIGSRSPTYNFNAVRLRFECAQILQIKCPESVFDRVADTDNSIFQTVSKQDDERASTSAQLGSTDSARTARGGECNNVPFYPSSTDRGAGYRATIAACSSNHVTRIAKILDARSRSKPQRGRKLFTFRVRIFLTS